jgi:hypothetical protein
MSRVKRVRPVNDQLDLGIYYVLYALYALALATLGRFEPRSAA